MTGRAITNLQHMLAPTLQIELGVKGRHSINIAQWECETLSEISFHHRARQEAI